MQLFFEIFPVFLFFLAFKFYGIYIATVAGIVTTLIQVVITRIWLLGKWDKKQLITLAVFLVFGGMTLYFHNPIFIKWKPTVVFWIFSLAILVSQFFTRKPIMQRLMENMFQDKATVPDQIWKKLNLIWAVFFISLGAVNLYIAYYFSNDAWVNFKFYGVTGALFIFSIFQALYLTRYMIEGKTEK
jgi:intracellular septation protein